MEALQSSRATTLTIADVGRHIQNQEPFPERSVALTFDDAIASVFTTAFPILQEAGFVATVFAVSGFMGGRSEWNPRETDKLQIMTGEELRALHEAGWEVGDHTHTHPRLTELDSTGIEDELHRSSDVLAELLGTPPRSFAYPYGAQNARARSVAGKVFDSSVVIGARRASLNNSLDLIDRIDAWYVPMPVQIERLRSPLTTAYLAVRRLGRRLQRI